MFKTLENFLIEKEQINLGKSNQIPVYNNQRYKQNSYQILINDVLN